MAYTVRVRGVEIVCETLEDIDQLIERYGGTAGMSAQPFHAPPQLGGPAGVAAADATLLQALVSAGQQGVSSESIGHMLGTKGKGIPPALQRWAARVGIARTEDGDVWEPARPQGARGWRLKNGSLAVARTLSERR
jgi:hypothetical protein